MSALTYCQSHDLFDCWLGHPASFPADPVPVEDLDAPTMSPAEMDAMAADFRSVRARQDVLLDVMADGSTRGWELLGQFNSRAWLVRSRNTGLLARVEMTSRNTWQTKLRLRFIVANDHGYGDGRVTFDGNTFGGWAWRVSLVAAGLATD